MSLPLEDALRQCDRHAQRMNRAMERIPFPLDGHELAEDNEELITLIDQFVFRDCIEPRHDWRVLPPGVTLQMDRK